jgi:hypothetical protein
VLDAINIVWRLSVATELILAVRLLWQGLGGVYPALTIASCGFALQASLLMLSRYLAHPKAAYFVAEKVTDPIVWVLWLWIVLELFSKWTRCYRGIGRFGQFFLGTLIFIALLISLISWPIEWKALVLYHDTRIYYMLTRVFMATLALFTLSVWLFFRNYPAPVPPNVVRHTHVTTIYLASMALSWLAFNLHQVAWGNLSIVVLAVGSFSAWAILLTRKGEEMESIPAMSADDIARIERVNGELLGLMKNLAG